MDSRIFKSIRKILNKTQKELAPLLGFSVKSIQSFEQGFRKVPSEAIRILLLLVHMRSKFDEVKYRYELPCWDNVSCPKEVKEKCVISEFHLDPHLCWFYNGTMCQGNADCWPDKLSFCQRCVFFRRIFKDLINNFDEDFLNLK